MGIENLGLDGFCGGIGYFLVIFLLRRVVGNFNFLIGSDRWLYTIFKVLRGNRRRFCGLLLLFFTLL